MGSMDLNGNGITVSNDVWAEMEKHIPVENGKPVHPIKADYLKPVVDSYKQAGKPFKMGMVFPVSTHNYELRYCVGEPWNQQAVFKGIGVPVITDYEIWKNNPEKVFGVSQGWADKYPNTHIRVVKALIRAAMWLDENDNANRPEAVKILAKSNYVGADEDVL